METNEILIQGLDLPVRIGVPEGERASWQVLSADIVMRPRLRFEEMRDDIASTIDYQAVAEAVKALAAARPRQLIETLAAEIAALVIGQFQAATVGVTLRKRILPGTDAVAVRVERTSATY
jgi:dihydroneopterin aldolase